ncbi:MAG TPA: class I SAM-dependent methyltransferase [Candidatus Edwardsbacteria bacterium]|nr:class I SAM-dependent methyltransferase [Candidatus Edwardsbacteria bacterium]
MPKDVGLHAYDERYHLVYGAGARFWNEHQPHPRLIECAKGLPAGAACIEFGCGEGFEARTLAAMDLKVTAIDLSPTVIAKAREETPAAMRVEYLAGDVTDLAALGIASACFDLAVDVHCLHMMSNPHDRLSYLAEVKRVLKPGGLFYLQDSLSWEDVQPADDEERKAIEEIRAFNATHQGGDNTPRRITTSQGEKEILLPLCPGCKAQSLQEYVDELTGAGFAIKQAERGGSRHTMFAAIIVAMA